MNMQNDLEFGTGVDLDEEIYSGFPAGWQSARDLTEGFLLVAALELQLRRRLNPYDPWSSQVYKSLPPRYRWDTFGSLLRYGPYSDLEWTQGPRSSDPAVQYMLSSPMVNSGERIGRLPMLAIVWEYVEKVVEDFSDLRGGDRYQGLAVVMDQLHGTSLGKHGSTLFYPAFKRAWMLDGPTGLSEVEKDFVAGRDIGGFPSGVLGPDGSSYATSIWQTAFRLIERSSPEDYISRLGHRRGDVEAVLEAGGRLGESGARSLWPGWPARATP